MKKKPRRGPTARILTLGFKAPGGVIRWNEARDEYVKGSDYAQEEEADAKKWPIHYKTSGRHYHQALGKILLTYFEPVEGARGFHVLKTSMFGDTTDDVLDIDLHEWEREEWEREAA